MYRGIYYDYRNSQINLATWDKDGNRIRRVFDFKPYYYTETSNDTPYRSIFGGKLKRHNFDNEFERRKSVKTSGMGRFYGNLQVEQQFLVDAYWKFNKKDGFSQHPLAIFYLDIEVYSPNEFPEQWDAKHPINVLTVYNSLKNEFRVFCLKKRFNPENLSKENKERYDKVKDKSKLKITEYSSEKELLSSFLLYWIEDYPDVVTGWNLPFDIPYICNRLDKLFGEKKKFLLSPANKVREIQRKQKTGPQEVQYIRDIDIEGISILDYHDVYMKFNIKPIPNRKLDTILGIELGVGKIKYESSNLAKLADEDWDLFVYYNIEDVNGIKLLEEKIKFLQTCRIISYMGLVPFKKSLETVPIINGYASVNALEEGKIIPTFSLDGKDWRDFEGGFVKEPKPNLYKDVVSFDLNSLYPMTIVTLNMSPETKFGRVRYEGDKAIVTDNAGKESKMSVENFKKLVKKANLSVSRSNVLFTQSKMGIFPKLVDEVYTKRVDVKKQLKELKKNGGSESEIQRLDVYQNSLKVIINSLYGYCGTPYATMSDVDIAESVTLTCQEVIKESSKILDNFVKKIIGDKDTTPDKYIVYNDTDSCYITVKDIVSHLGLDFYNRENGCVNEQLIKICETIESSLNKKIKKWGVETLNSRDCRFQFKMEVIADRGFFLKKKKYIVHKLYDEGIDVVDPDKRWKYTGIQLVSASMPEQTKPLVESILKSLMLETDKKVADELYMKAYYEFEKLDVDDIAIIKSINKFNEYVEKCDGWEVAPRMQATYRGAYYYNKLLDELGISHMYEKIKQGDKVKTLYLNPNNRFGINVISYINMYPKEFVGVLDVDKQEMFEKCVKNVVKTFYTVVGWDLFSPSYQPCFDIDDF